MDILYKDEHIIVINKPAGLPVLPDGWEKDAPYLVKMLEEEFGKVYIIHRLDKVTSGVIIFARTADAHRTLNIQLEKHEAEKVYHAIMEGEPRWNEKTTKFPLRTNVGHKHRTMVDDKNGKPSETRFRILKRYQAHPESDRDLLLTYVQVRDAALVEAKPMTGRTHQIRVHAYALGHPLLGDTLYGASETELIARPALHAHSITFTHPATNERLTFTAERPQDFVSALKLLDV
jgi:RluA family pseudouridine synthase